MNKFYIYLHYRKTDGKVFYVGKGSGNRAYSTDSRNSHWRAIVAKYGYYTEIIFDDLTEEESFDLEKNTILELKYFGYRLANKTHGGEGVSGYRHTKETKLKLIDNTIYTFISRYGEVFTGTRFELSQKYNLDINRICELFSKRKRKTSQGWSLNIDNNEGN